VVFDVGGLCPPKAVVLLTPPLLTAKRAVVGQRVAIAIGAILVNCSH